MLMLVWVWFLVCFWPVWIATPAIGRVTTEGTVTSPQEPTTERTFKPP